MFQKLTIEGIKTLEHKDKRHWIAKKNVLGKTSSKLPMSLEKRFKMRPAGLVSKNSTGACSKLETILSWRRSDDLREARKKRTAQIKGKRNAMLTRPP